MENCKIVMDLRDGTGRIRGYSQLISKKTRDKEILELTLNIMHETRELMKLLDRVESELHGN
ncbi:hypothetical protein [Desulforamulus aquiferis]|uniref:PAC domain-containing protein n=1 Tax=Desulforamulus aquiferis TaxID=1397668 RepID=A0AAW7ZH12_9FIRM|nr:hypothetical protein [Desulforamulus aquiferis]MDO7788530.1 hypothetical protein [Desulforamulus aquiferis]RYD05040.1 hypothetical protein N752_11330 [Desulforamulus aquiferis]